MTIISAFACVPTKTCFTGMCEGCCLEGTCMRGSTDTACGVGGAMCVSCVLGGVCASGTCTVSGPVDSGVEGSAYVAAHNRVRSTVSPAPAQPLPPVTWSAAAEAQATSWARRCTFEHSMAQGWGENLYASASNTEPSANEVLTSWASEVADYDYAANTCRAGKQCGHYTQVVWSTSTSIGCALQACSKNSPFANFTNWFLVVCNYAPPGNYVGEKPY